MVSETEDKVPFNQKPLVDVGLCGLPYPMKVASRQDPAGQATVASISISARIIHEFQAQWIHRFVQILHNHRENIGTEALRGNILDYLGELQATSVRVSFDYPYFVQKVTPCSGERCLVRYNCTYTAKVTDTDRRPRIRFKMEIPVLTTDPASTPDQAEGLFAQLSKVQVEVQPLTEAYPEDLVDIVDKHCLAPLYSFLTESDKSEIIYKVHSTRRSSVVMVDAIQGELACNSGIEWYSVSCENLSMLNCYSTVVGTGGNLWMPSTCYDFADI